MAQTGARRLWSTGELLLIDNSNLDSLGRSLEHKLRNGKDTLARACPGTKLGDITYDSDCVSAGYDPGLLGDRLPLP